MSDKIIEYGDIGLNDVASPRRPPRSQPRSIRGRLTVTWRLWTWGRGRWLQQYPGRDNQGALPLKSAWRMSGLLRPTPGVMGNQRGRSV